MDYIPSFTFEPIKFLTENLPTGHMRAELEFFAGPIQSDDTREIVGFYFRWSARVISNQGVYITSVAVDDRYEDKKTLTTGIMKQLVMASHRVYADWLTTELRKHLVVIDTAFPYSNAEAQELLLALRSL